MDLANSNNLLSLKEICFRARVSRRQLARWRKAQDFPPPADPRRNHLRFCWHEVNAWIRANSGRMRPR
jgi:predicted DNA-binding transcriptional regulator AlpA